MTDAWPSATARRLALTAALRSRIVVVGGATGSVLLGRRLEAGGENARSGPVDVLCLWSPGAVAALHAAYVRAGADLIETNSFNAHPLSLARFGLADMTGDINQRAAALARAVADEHATAHRPLWVAGVLGPTSTPMSRGGADGEALRDGYLAQAAALLDGGADVLLVETAQDLGNIECALSAVDELERVGGQPIPVIVSATLESSGTMLDGHSVEDLCLSLDGRDLLAVGVNCSTGPASLDRQMRSLSEIAATSVFCCPSAGLPDTRLRYPETPESFAAAIGKFIDEGWVNFVGGCCGTSPDYIRLVAMAAAGKRPRRV